MFDVTIKLEEDTLIPFRSAEFTGLWVKSEVVTVAGNDVFILDPDVILRLVKIYNWAEPFSFTKELVEIIMKLFAVPIKAA